MALFSLAIKLELADWLGGHDGVGIEKNARHLIGPTREDQELGVERAARAVAFRRGPSKCHCTAGIGVGLGEPVEERTRTPDAPLLVTRDRLAVPA